MINPDGVRHQIHGNVIQSTAASLEGAGHFRRVSPSLRANGAAIRMLTFTELPAIDVLMVPRPEDAAIGRGESASVPSAAAIANAIFDATGVRFREPPFTAGPRPRRPARSPAAPTPPAPAPRLHGARGSAILRAQ